MRGALTMVSALVFRAGRDLGAIALLAGATLAVFWRLVFTDEFTLLASYDNAAQYYPWYRYASSVLQRGELPLWDPYTFSGRPLVGDPESALFYPLHLLFFLVAPSPLSVRALEGFTIVGHFLAGAFMFLLSRSLGVSRFGALASGLVFALGGSVGGQSARQVGVFQALIWLPLAFLCFRRALHRARRGPRLLWAAGAGLGLSLSVLAGHPQPALLMALALAGFGVAWRVISTAQEVPGPSGRGYRLIETLVATAVAGAAFSAVQIVPALEFGPSALRWLGPGEPVPASGPLSYQASGEAYALAPRALAALVFPVILGVADISPYFGVLPLALALLGIAGGEPRSTVRFLTLLLVAAFVYSLGSASLLHGLSYAVVPFLGSVRVPSRGLYLFHFAAAVLAGIGADRLGERLEPRARERARALVRALVAGAGACAALAIGGVVLKRILRGALEASDDEWLLSALLLILTAAVLGVWRGRGGARPAVKAAALALILLDLAHFGVGKGIAPRREFDGLRNFSPAELYRLPEIVDLLARRARLHRVEVREDALPPNVGSLNGFTTTWGYATLVYRDYYEFLRQDRHPGSRIQDLLGVRFVVTRTGTLDLPLVWEGGIRVYENPEAFPRAWIVHATEVVPDRRHALARVVSLDFDPRRVAVIDRPLATSLGSVGATEGDRVEITHYAPTRVAAHARLGHPGLLVLSEVDYPGWRARINGRPAQLYRANGLFRAVPLEAGDSLVTIEYRPRSVLFGALVSGSAGVVLLIAVGVAIRRRLREGRA